MNEIIHMLCRHCNKDADMSVSSTKEDLLCMKCRHIIKTYDPTKHMILPHAFGYDPDTVAKLP